MSVTSKEHFDNPRLLWDIKMGCPNCVVFDEILEAVTTEDCDAKSIFMYYDILFPSDMIRFPKYIYTRLAGSYGTMSQKKNELELLSKFGIVRKQKYFVTDAPELFSSLPVVFNRDTLSNHQSDVDSLLKSIEACISRRNSERLVQNLPKYTLSRGKIVHDEMIVILQILRAKILCHVD